MAPIGDHHTLPELRLVDASHDNLRSIRTVRNLGSNIIAAAQKAR
jgi:hypothetical protein